MSIEIPDQQLIPGIEPVEHESSYGTYPPETPVDAFLTAQDAALLAEIGISTIEDFLGYYPKRYVSRGVLTQTVGSTWLGQPLVFWGHVQEKKLLKLKRFRKMLKVRIQTQDGALVEAVFFDPEAANAALAVGQWALFSGTLEEYAGSLSLKNPDFEVGQEPYRLMHPIQVVYPGKKNVPASEIERVRDLVLGQCAPLGEHLPEEILSLYQLVDFDTALRCLHSPANFSSIHQAVRRLKFEEAFAVQLVMALRSWGATRSVSHAFRPVAGGLVDQYTAALPYELTEGQASAGAGISEDLGLNHPMKALVLGDVGAGKTVVANRALLQVVDSGGQGAFIAPTEVLATQHYEGVKEELEALGVRVELFTGSLKPSEKKKILLRLVNGEVDILIGTHAVLSSKVKWSNLGLAVIDEQHRFGVKQRDKLAELIPTPHLLSMSATPIPRTLAMTVHGDMKVYELHGVPAGRKPVQSFVVPTYKQSWVHRFWQVVSEQVRAGRQVFIVGAKVDDTSKAEKSPYAGAVAGEVKTVYEIAQETSNWVPGAKVAVMHGKLPADEKQAVMDAFAAGSIDVLVSTTVIEVGVNVPNSTIMAVVDADRFGMAQLHQLRGRVGRGQHPGWCFLLTQAEPDSEAMKRLEQVASTRDGFLIAQMDMENRKEGDILGDNQAGKTRFKVLSMVEDTAVIEAARVQARRLVETDPVLRSHPQLSSWLYGYLSEDERSALLRT